MRIDPIHHIDIKIQRSIYAISSCSNGYSMSARAVLISNDRHFEKIRNAGLIEVWTISQAMVRLL